MGATEGFGAIADQNEGLDSDVGNLIVILCAEKDDLIFSNDAFFALESFHGRFTLEHQKGLGGQMIMHICVVARHEIDYPRTKRVSAKERNESLIFSWAVRMVSLIFANSIVSPLSLRFLVADIF